MKFVKYSSLLVLVALSLSLTTLAKDKNEGNFTLTGPTQVGSTQLSPGTYKAEWEGTGADVQVKIYQGKNVVATSSAKLVDNASPVDAVTLRDEGGAKTLNEIHFSNLHKALVFGSPASGQN